MRTGAGARDGQVVKVLFIIAAWMSASPSSYLLLTPIIPQAPTVRGGTAGGWANLNLRRLFGLLALNAIGIHGFNGLPVIDFNKPAKFWDGTETLSYSYRLNVSYHPRYRYQNDIRALGAPTLSWWEPTTRRMIPKSGCRFSRELRALDKIMRHSHFGIFSDPATLDVAVGWLRGLPESAGQ